MKKRVIALENALHITFVSLAHCSSKVSNVEFDTPKISQNEIDDLEEECNQKIMEHRDIKVHLMTKEEAMELEEVKTRGLPDGIVDNIRVIEIQGNVTDCFITKSDSLAMNFFIHHILFVLIHSFW